MTVQSTPASAGRAPNPSAAPGPRVPRRPPSRRRSRVWALLGYTGLGIVFLVIAAVTFLLVAPPVDTTRERVTTEFRARTGYVLELNGPTSLRLLPTPSVEFRDVVVATSEVGGAPVLRAEAVEVEARLWPLIFGKVRASQVSLRRPQLDLVVGQDGRRRWLKAEMGALMTRTVRTFQVQREGDAGRFSTPALREDDEKPKAGERPLHERAGSLEAGDLTIQVFDGIVRYRDLRSGSLTQADQVQLRLTRRDDRKGAPLRGRGSLAYNGENVKVDVSADLREGMARGVEKISLRLTSKHGNVRYDGGVDLAEQVSLSGMVDLTTPSASEAAKWLGARVRDSSTWWAGPIALKGRLEAQEGRVRLEQMQLKLQGIEGGGLIEVALAKPRPRFAADLVFAELDLDRVRTRGDAARARPGEERERKRSVRRVEASPAPPQAVAKRDANDPADDVPVRESRGPREWRTDPIAFANLGVADGEARLKVARVVWRGAVLTDAVGVLSLSDGGMTLDIQQGALHGGTAKGVVNASAAGQVAIDMALDGVSALETLGNSGRFEVLDGPARIRLAVVGQGTTEKEIVGTLAGSASLDIADGAILGWSVEKIIASARRLEMPNLDRDPAARTPFSRLSATLAIKDGVATGKTMRIAASPISLDSAGTIDLPARTLDLTLNPRLADEAATGAASRLAGLSVPLKLNGPWHRPRLSGDYQHLLKSPQKVIEGARDAARGIKDEDIDKAAKRLLGDSPEAEKGAKRAKDLLKRFLDR